jgi:hypothetical protein
VDITTNARPQLGLQHAGKCLSNRKILKNQIRLWEMISNVAVTIGTTRQTPTFSSCPHFLRSAPRPTPITQSGGNVYCACVGLWRPYLRNVVERHKANILSLRDLSRHLDGCQIKKCCRQALRLVFRGSFLKVNVK